MLNWWKELDRILRGETTRPDNLKDNHLAIPVGGVSLVLLFLAAFAGACVGSFSVFRTDELFYKQLIASTVKVPLLFLLTLIVTFPSLYVFNALVGSRLSLGSVLKLLLATMGVTISVLAAFGPIVVFFSVSTTSYSFTSLLNVTVFGLAGVLGLRFLMQTLHRLNLVQNAPSIFVEPDKDQGQAGLSALDSYLTVNSHVKIVFRCWVVVFALVGSQMSWVLRPFIGDPRIEFEWLRPRHSNFFQSVWGSLVNFFS